MSRKRRRPGVRPPPPGGETFQLGDLGPPDYVMAMPPVRMIYDPKTGRVIWRASDGTPKPTLGPNGYEFPPGDASQPPAASPADPA